jgi:hypothetical protein
MAAFADGGSILQVPRGVDRGRPCHGDQQLLPNLVPLTTISTDTFAELSLLLAVFYSAVLAASPMPAS